MKNEVDQAVERAAESALVNVSEPLKQIGVVAPHEQEDVENAASAIRQGGVGAEATGPHIPPATEPSKIINFDELRKVRDEEKRMPIGIAGKWRRKLKEKLLERRLKRAA